ncbi:MAG: YmaF family protein, partial [Bacilli bacterium]|nr:YmaF family protein [Bacilli bacterium]
PVQNGHIHEIVGNTSFDDMHIHQIRLQTGIQIPVGNNRHVHFANGITTTDDGHTHNLQFTTLI